MKEHIYCKQNILQSNNFKALPAFIKKLPEPQIAFPKAETQQAKVIDNADPKNQGRIRVKMLWQQTKNLRTPWLRVMTPDAGTSGEVATNRGMVFIPEIGDHVMLGFRYNDPNRPFVMGSLFNGTTGAGGQSQNHLKSIFTRGGSTITFNELDNSILVKDPSGNTWFMDGKGNISVTAPKNFTVNAGANITMTAGKNVSVSAGDDMDHSAGKNITQTAMGNITEMSNNRTEMVEKDFMRQADTSNEIASEVSVFSQKENMTLQSGKTVEVNSAEQSKMF
ncbi:phage baseplate assembly protein V [Flavobacterium branchiophilum]|uniref:phage baseplate assembly protein V n=1 Tax=Flavobacterium branchiophilum TaxID=55197 RepID=UPI001179FBAA|nr:phage baseplate assembly protein V [Flavobacterium branchiophilum]